MKKIALLLSVLLVVFYSCSKDAVLNQDTILVKKYTSTMANGQIFTNTITYNGNKIVDLTQQGAGNKWVYTYTGNLITKVNVYDNIGTLTWTINYFYNNDNLIKSETVASPTPTIIGRVTYTYNSDSTINVVYSQVDTTTNQETIRTWSNKYYFSEGNLVKTESTDINNGSLVTKTSTSLYDSKNNPFKNAIGFIKIKLDDDITFVSVNNSIGDLVNNQGVSPVEKDVYTYNADNYPIERKVYFDGNLALTNQFFY